MDVLEKLKIWSDAAKYDVSCSSEGSNRKIKMEDLEMQRPVEYAIAGLMMEDVFLY